MRSATLHVISLAQCAPQRSAQIDAAPGNATHFYAVSCGDCEVLFPPVSGKNGWHPPDGGERGWHFPSTPPDERQPRISFFLPFPFAGEAPGVREGWASHYLIRADLRVLAQRLAKAYFVSTSRLLDQMFGNEHGSLTWLPDVFFRHLSLIAPSQGDTESLIESLYTELGDLGVTIVDVDAYQKYFSPLISSTVMSFASEKNTLVGALQDEAGATPEELQREFDETPDISKPFFVAQMQWKTSARGAARLERELSLATRQKQELEEKLKITDSAWMKRQSDTIRHFENRIRNLTDPTRRKKAERKRRNEKKRRRKKRR